MQSLKSTVKYRLVPGVMLEKSGDKLKLEKIKKQRINIKESGGKTGFTPTTN